MKTAFSENEKMRRIRIAAAVLVLLLLPLSWMLGRVSAADAPAIGKDTLSEMVRITQAHTRSAEEREQLYLAAFARVDEGDVPDVAGDSLVEVISVTETAVSFCVTDMGSDLSPYGRVVFYNLDPATGRHLTLADIMGEGWRNTVADAVIPMIEKDPATYELVDVIPMINKDRMFCIAEDGTVQIVFDCGEIAPDSAGIRIYPISVGK